MKPPSPCVTSPAAAVVTSLSSPPGHRGQPGAVQGGLVSEAHALHFSQKAELPVGPPPGTRHPPRVLVACADICPTSLLLGRGLVQVHGSACSLKLWFAYNFHRELHNMSYFIDKTLSSHTFFAVILAKTLEAFLF